MRHSPVLVALLSLIAAASLDAQTIRGTVVDESTKLPLQQVAITLIDATGVEIRPGAQSDTNGNFTIHAPRAGAWRVKGMRIGFSPVTSDPVRLAIGGLTVVRLRLTPVAQQLVPIQVVERRRLSATELMSTTGFDLRESRGLGRFLSGQTLANMGEGSVGTILATHFQPTLYVYADPVLGDVLRLRQGASSCPPEIFLDGRLLATAPEPTAVFSTAPPVTPSDSVRALTSAEGEQFRLGAGQMHAFTLLSSYSASQLYGVEVYRSNEVPPASLGAWFGMTRSSIRACGTVAVWTKAGARSLAAARSSSGGRAIQVVTGTLVDFDTGLPLAGRTVSLLTAAKDRTGIPVVTDERGDFTLRTSRAGELRLTSGGNNYITSTTPPFSVAPDELVVVKLFVSNREGVLAPLGIAARVLPQTIGVTSLSGFTYRRERALGGSFFTAREIASTGAASINDLLRPVVGMAATCAPAYYLDGAQLTDGAPAKVAALDLSRVFGVEVYTKPAEIPSVFSDAGACGVIVIWMMKN